MRPNITDPCLQDLSDDGGLRLGLAKASRSPELQKQQLRISKSQPSSRTSAWKAPALTPRRSLL